MVNVPLGSQRCNIVCVSNNQAVLGNFGPGVLTERLGQSLMAGEAVIFCVIFMATKQCTYEELLKLQNK